MTQVNRHLHEFSLQGPGNSERSYASPLPLSQEHEIYSGSHDMFSVQQHIGTSSSENANITEDQRPALPPKPFQGPPVYREPPCPPVIEDPNRNPDICINSSPARPTDSASYSHSSIAQSTERQERPTSRTHAWVQEHKTSGKIVGEKLSTLQRKLRSFLGQSSNKECVEIDKASIEDKAKFEVTQRSQSSFPSNFNQNHPSTSSHRYSYLSHSYEGDKGALPNSQPPAHIHQYKPYPPERHPFAATTSEHEDSTDPDQLRDTCNRLFARDQRISWTNYLSPRNCYSNNIKSSYDHDKLVPKEVIGKPSQDKKCEVLSNCEAIYGDIAPLPSFSTQELSSRKIDLQSTRTKDSSFAPGVQYTQEESMHTKVPHELSSMPSNQSKASSEETTAVPATPVPDCIDSADIYKSSSESGRGTMHSSRHGSKSVVSPHSSGVSAASNLDTSLDSDHSANGSIWNRKKDKTRDKRHTEEFPVNQVRHIYETPSTSTNMRQVTEKEHGDATSESLSVTPPLPPASTPPSPPLSSENSPKLSSRARYKLSQSASALNSYSKSNDLQKNVDASGKISGKKSGVRRTSSINQAICRQRNGKSLQHTKTAPSSGHRLGVAYSNCASRKCNASPPRHSKSQLVLPSCYLDNNDPELTSTTTGLDMESLLDEDEYSSDFSMSASTMEPTEVSMIRRQLEGLETMYSEILRLLGVKNSSKSSPFANPMDIGRPSRRKLNGSLSSINAHSSATRSNNSFADKRVFSEKRYTKDIKNSSANKRLQRLESHVVTLARSVAHLSSEMRSQHMLVQELENMRQDITWVQERMRLMQLAQGCHPSNNPGRNHQLAMPRDWDNFHKEVLELLNPCRAKKLTKFFGDEPPLIRQFLKRLGYEKYAINFENEKIGIKELPYLTEERLQKMGVPMGPRIRILQEAHACGPQNQYKVYIV